MPVDITNNPANFSCRNCGACCRWPGHVLLTQQDVTAISTALEMKEDDFIQRYTTLASNRSGLSLIEQSDGACHFLTAGNKCRIYNTRPQQCRDFPEKWRVKGCPALE